MLTGFNHHLYLKKQTESIKNRLKQFPDKLYLEFGGKIISDNHASRVLPGFKKNTKMTILKELSSLSEIIICISSLDIERKKIRKDFDMTYAQSTLKMYKIFQKHGLGTPKVVITRITSNSIPPLTKKFIGKLKQLNIRYYLHFNIPGYPINLEKILSSNGFGKNPYIKTSKQLVVIVAPGPGSGKLATCLSQLYHDSLHKIKAGYAKFETFPVWNLPLDHPVNLAYEAATIDLKDKNHIDSFHLNRYKIKAVNYNRDLEVFPILKKILTKIFKKDIYHSPTDMGVNQVGFCISNDQVIKKAALKEIIERKKLVNN